MRVTDEALIAETAVWPNFFLMNIFSALEGSKLFIIIGCYFVLRKVSALTGFWVHEKRKVLK